MIQRLDQDVLLEVLKFAGPRGSCDLICCRDLALPYAATRQLWKFFLQTYYLPSIEDSAEDDDWRGAYFYISSSLGSAQWLDATSLFSDDGGHIAGYPAQNALGNGQECWCTRPGVDRNVDLIAELQIPALVTAFRIANPAVGYTMPVRDALAFASFDVPNLDARRIYDVDEQNSEMGPQTAAVLKGEVAGAAGVRFDVQDLAKAARGSKDDVTAIARCGAPTIANFVHFKLLSSYHPDGSTVNIDVRHLHVLGFPLPELGTFLPSHRRCLDRLKPTQPPRDWCNKNLLDAKTQAALDAVPLYKRIHPDLGLDDDILRRRRVRLRLADVDEEHWSALRSDIISMMIVTPAGIMTHMPIHLATLHPPPLSFVHN